MLLHLAERLAVPLRERNQLMLAAGYAPVYEQRTLEDPDMEPVRDAIEQVLAGIERHPAVVVDRHWELLAGNRGVGFGAGFTPTMIRMIGGLPPALAADASGLITTNVQLCYALGVATIGSAYASAGVPTFGGVAEACGALTLAATALAAWMLRRAGGAAAEADAVVQLSS